MSNTRNFTYDDAQLQQLFEQLDEKSRTQALRGAFRREARHLKKKAVQNLRSSTNPGNKKGFHSSPALEKGIRTIVYKRTAGFRVTVGTQTNRRKGTVWGYHTNRRGETKPILMWAEDGTKARYTKPKQGSRRRASRLRELHYTGSMPAVLFLEEARKSETGTITESLHDEIRKYVTTVAKKKGCIV